MENQSVASSPSIARTGIVIVVLHFLVTIAHGTAHQNLHITMNAWQSVYIMLIIFLLPLISAVLLLRKRTRIGFWLLFASMLGSLLFGGYYHFVAAGADNVASLGAHDWAPVFQITAALLALTETAGTVTGFVGLRHEG